MTKKRQKSTNSLMCLPWTSSCCLVMCTICAEQESPSQPTTISSFAITPPIRSRCWLVEDLHGKPNFCTGQRHIQTMGYAQLLRVVGFNSVPNCRLTLFNAWRGGEWMDRCQQRWSPNRWWCRDVTVLWYENNISNRKRLQPHRASAHPTTLNKSHGDA